MPYGLALGVREDSRAQGKCVWQVMPSAQNVYGRDRDWHRQRRESLGELRFQDELQLKRSDVSRSRIAR